ncbi:InlB B-repeat-containing protein [Candidatus Saccharibacteria bacterium]|nr:InlB B-repeat-containing protein [Candidatus Saccharibacteria bacterium]
MESASAYSVNKDYILYKKTKSGNDYYLYYNDASDTFMITDSSPRINLNKDPNGCGGFNGNDDVISAHDYTNCTGLVIKPSGSNTWFDQARYSFEIGDFDHTETISVSGGYIYDWGSSLDTVNGSRQFARSHSGDTSANCDSPNWNGADKCSVLIIFNPSYSGDFKITLDNDANSASHEYTYDGPKHKSYRTLTFHPNGGSVTDSPSDSSAIWPHMSGTDLLREYVKGVDVTQFPTPTREDCGFVGWSHETSGGDIHPSVSMDSDVDLYAQWSCFHLEPAVSVSPLAIAAGESFNVNPTINNSGNSSSATASYSLVKTITNPNEPGATTSGSGTFAANSGPVTVLGYTETDTDYVAATHICFVLTVSPHSALDPGSVSSSPPACVVIGKSPKTQVWGGDLLAGSEVQTSTSTPNGITFGSWVEYAIFATGSIKRAGSGSAFSGTGMTGATACGYSTLTFTNGSSSTCNEPPSLGGYTVQEFKNISDSFPGTTPIAGTVIVNNLSGTYLDSSPADLVLNSNNDITTSIVIKKPSGRVVINNNQKYVDGSYNSIYGLPQLVIIAHEIVINDGVTDVDSWLVANDGTGSVKTCSSEAKIVDDCNNPLVVNGPVITDELYLWRTAGADKIAGSGNPAELFNLRADTYLWVLARNSRAGRISTVNTTELPPRL